ncbi:MAG TPA: AMED_5909 family protein [Pseudonocardiaceae bacterium]|nr:AMED_5909 family protein [Pseudonocardiaceae bacterium]
MQTLRAAHELLHRHWPGDHPPSPALLDYHLGAADLYDRIAETDAAHQHEAPYWAHQERDAAQAIADQISASTQASASD